MSTATSVAFDRDSWASFYAKRHLDIDDAVEQIFYLPENAPAREIRFLEVNRSISEMSPPEPIDFGVDTGGVDEHKLYVLDVTPAQWKQLQDDNLSLPDGWTLAGCQAFDRNTP